MKKHDDAVYLSHIVECIQAIERYINTQSVTCLQNEILHDAILRKLQIMSESTQKLSDGVKQNIPQIS